MPSCSLDTYYANIIYQGLIVALHGPSKIIVRAHFAKFLKSLKFC